MLSSQSREFHKFICAINCCSYGFPEIFFGEIFFSRNCANNIFTKLKFIFAKSLRNAYENVRIFSRKFSFARNSTREEGFKSWEKGF